jgi:hypothetical protein
LFVFWTEDEFVQLVIRGGFVIEEVYIEEKQSEWITVFARKADV